MAEEKVFLQPTEGSLIRDPQSKTPLPIEGGYVALNNFFRRRIRDGSVVVVSHTFNDEQ